MLNLNSIKRYIRQILAITEKNIYLELRVKSRFFFRFINPIIQLLLFVFIFGVIFNIKKGFQLGYWNSNNYILFLIIAFSIQFSKSPIAIYDTLFNTEKYWKTLSATMTAPVHRFILLFGILFSEIVLNCIPIGILLIIALILFPIPLIYFFLFLLLFLLIFIIFGSIGLLIGIFRISKEELVSYSKVILRIIFLFSCTNYPKELFPEIIQNIIILNPFYYIFDLLRLVWYLGIDYDAAMSNISPIHIIVTLILIIISPIISIFLFEFMYKKYGITGY